MRTRMTSHTGMRGKTVPLPHKGFSIDEDVGAASGGRCRREMAAMAGPDIAFAVCWGHSHLQS